MKRNNLGITALMNTRKRTKNGRKFAEQFNQGGEGSCTCTLT